MKLPLLLVLLLTGLFAGDTYLLPHRRHDARHQLNSLIRHAKTPVVVITHSIGDIYLQRGLRFALQNALPVILITDSKATASHWAMYRSLYACILPAHPLPFSLISVGKGKACILSASMDTDAMRSGYGIMSCTDSADVRETIRLLKQECRPYFHKGTTKNPVRPQRHRESHK